MFTIFYRLLSENRTTFFTAPARRAAALDKCGKILHNIVMATEKTNAMRILDQNHISYLSHRYDAGLTDGLSVARAVGKDPASVFKTLVTAGSDLSHYIFVIPVEHTLDLKKEAAAMGVKSVSMLKQRDLFPLTGYVHGGCSPLGMKKQFRTAIDETAILFDAICVSAGKIGCQIELSPFALAELTGAAFCDLTD